MNNAFKDLDKKTLKRLLERLKNYKNSYLYQLKNYAHLQKLYDAMHEIELKKDIDAAEKTVRKLNYLQSVIDDKNENTAVRDKAHKIKAVIGLQNHFDAAKKHIEASLKTLPKEKHQEFLTNLKNQITDRKLKDFIVKQIKHVTFADPNEEKLEQMLQKLIFQNKPDPRNIERTSDLNRTKNNIEKSLEETYEKYGPEEYIKTAQTILNSNMADPGEKSAVLKNFVMKAKTDPGVMALYNLENLLQAKISKKTITLKSDKTKSYEDKGRDILNINKVKENSETKTKALKEMRKEIEEKGKKEDTAKFRFLKSQIDEKLEQERKFLENEKTLNNLYNTSNSAVLSKIKEIIEKEIFSNEINIILSDFLTLKQFPEAFISVTSSTISLRHKFILLNILERCLKPKTWNNEPNEKQISRKMKQYLKMINDHEKTSESHSRRFVNNYEVSKKQMFEAAADAAERKLKTQKQQKEQLENPVNYSDKDVEEKDFNEIKTTIGKTWEQIKKQNPTSSVLALHKAKKESLEYFANKALKGKDGRKINSQINEYLQPIIDFEKTVFKYLNGIINQENPRYYTKKIQETLFDKAKILIDNPNPRDSIHALFIYYNGEFDLLKEAVASGLTIPEDFKTFLNMNQYTRALTTIKNAEKETEKTQKTGSEKKNSTIQRPSKTVEPQKEIDVSQAYKEIGTQVQKISEEAEVGTRISDIITDQKVLLRKLFLENKYRKHKSSLYNRILERLEYREDIFKALINASKGTKLNENYPKCKTFFYKANKNKNSEEAFTLKRYYKHIAPLLPVIKEQKSRLMAS